MTIEVANKPSVRIRSGYIYGQYPYRQFCDVKGVGDEGERNQPGIQTSTAEFITIKGTNVYCFGSTGNTIPSPWPERPDPKINAERQKKAENKAVLLLQNMIGVEQCDIYRKTHRVILKPGRFYWIIGCMADFNVDKTLIWSFVSKPDVIRIDSFENLHVTYFCVNHAGKQPVPFTDKVISFACHLISNEKSFVEKINRIREDTLDKMPQCATWFNTEKE